MKKFVFTLVAFLMTSSFTTAAYAGSGKAFFTYRRGQNHHQTLVALSNITDTTITVKLKIYTNMGSLFIDDGSASSGTLACTNYASGYTESISDYSVEFNIAPLSTAELDIRNYGTACVNGFGILEWSNDSSSESNGLLAWGYHYLNAPSDGKGIFYFPINNGLPF